MHCYSDRKEHRYFVILLLTTHPCPILENPHNKEQSTSIDKVLQLGNIFLVFLNLYIQTITASRCIRRLSLYTLKRQSLSFLMGMDNVRHRIERVPKLQSRDGYSSNSQPSYSINVPEFQLSHVNKGNQEFSLENRASSWGNILNVLA